MERRLGDLISLRRARKARDRQDRQRTAAENRVRFGRDGATRRQEVAERERAAATLDGLHLEPSDSDRTD
jgi:hypothetical protein